MNAAEDAIHVIIPIFCVATMFAMGLDVTLAEAVAPLRQMLALGITVLVNNVLIPLLGFLVIALPALLAADWLANFGLKDLALTGGAQMGFLLLMLASGSLLGPTLARIAGANEATAKGVMVMLAVASAVLVPVELQLLCSSSAIKACRLFRAVDTGSVFMLLLLFQLLPLAVGIAIKARYDAVAVRLRPLIMQLMGLTLLVLLAIIVQAKYQLMQAQGEAVLSKAELLPMTEPAKSTTWLPDDDTLRLTIKDLTVTRPIAQLDDLEIVGLSASPELTTAVWALVESGRKYTIASNTTQGAAASSASGLKISGPNAFVLSTSPDFNDKVGTAVDSLKRRAISPSLRDDFAKQYFVLPSNLATAIDGSDTWMLTNADKTYFVEAVKKENNTIDKLKIYQETLSPLAPSEAQAKPSGFVGAILTFLEGIPVVGQVVSFLAQFVVLLLPYALLAALVALLLVVGKYTGVAVRNVVGASGEGIPRAMAISTAVRNVSIALLVANQYYSLSSDFGAIAIILVFYLINLIVTAHEAVAWGKKSAVEATAAQGQTGAAADVVSVPAM